DDIVLDLGQMRRVEAASGHPVQELDQLFLVLDMRAKEFTPGFFLGRPNPVLDLPFEFAKFFLATDSVFQDPFPEPFVAVVLPFPLQALGRCGAFLGPRGRRPWWLREFDYMDQDGHMAFPNYIASAANGMGQGGIVPSLDLQQLEAVGVRVPLQGR